MHNINLKVHKFLFFIKKIILKNIYNSNKKYI